MTTVINIKDPKNAKLLVHEDYVYCGRPSRWGNPYAVGLSGDREAVIEKHKAYILDNPKVVQSIREGLTGKILGCFCKPLPCHCDTYVEICDGPRE